MRSSYMRKGTAIAIVIGTLLAAWIGYVLFGSQSVKNVPLRPNGPILFFGDSLVEGVGASVGHDLPALLTKSLGEPVLNYGAAGDTTEQGFSRVTVAVAEHPRLVLVLLGGNDFLRKVPRDETFSNLKRIVDTFQSDGAAVVIIGVRSGIVGGGSDDRYEALARETGSMYVEDALKGVFGDPTLMSDAIHPNDRGYQKIADRLVLIIQELIAK